MGSDYNDGAAGFGPKRALKLAQAHLGWEASLRRAGLDPVELEPVRELFRHPEVAEVPEPAFRAPDCGTLARLLVDGHGFSDERVSAALRRVRPISAAPPPAPTSRARQASLDGFGTEEHR